MADAADHAVARGDATRAAADAVLAELNSRLENGTFMMLMTMFTVHGTKPS
jgi:hypothetical protein